MIRLAGLTLGAAIWLAVTPARAEVQRLAARLFGATVGEIEFELKTVGEQSTVAYRSDLLVVRDRVRLRQRAFIESRFETDSGRLLGARARRCTAPAESPSHSDCSAWREVGADPEGAIPAIAAELILSRKVGAADPVCLPTVDEESGERGEICAELRRTPEGVELRGTKLGAAFRALVRGDRLMLFEATEQGARFEAVEGRVQVSDADLFAGPVEFDGDARAALRRGRLRVKLEGHPFALEVVRRASGPGQRVREVAGALEVDKVQVPVPRDRKARAQLDRIAFLLMQSRGTHEDCQVATDWFLEQARQRGWKARRATGVAFVEGRFAWHAWAVVDTGAGEIPVDPLLAQAPADAGHLELVPAGEEGEALVRLRQALRLVVLPASE